MMKITINGQPKTFEAPLNLYDILAQEELIGMMIAVAHNGNVIPKGNYTQIFIEDGDSIEIVAPMQGG
ncbi:MAG: sulfur carrier protein ThiS [Alphaproteobacteria bacterium]